MLLIRSVASQSLSSRDLRPPMFLAAVAARYLKRMADHTRPKVVWDGERCLAPEGFGRFSGDLLVGNFGDGRIHAFDPATLTSEVNLKLLVCFIRLPADRSKSTGYGHYNSVMQLRESEQTG